MRATNAYTSSPAARARKAHCCSEGAGGTPVKVAKGLARLPSPERADATAAHMAPPHFILSQVKGRLVIAALADNPI